MLGAAEWLTGRILQSPRAGIDAGLRGRGQLHADVGIGIAWRGAHRRAAGVAHRRVAHECNRVALAPITTAGVLHAPGLGEFTAGTNYAYVEVLSGEKKSYKGYVNSDYITKLGEPTVRIGTEE